VAVETGGRSHSGSERGHRYDSLDAAATAVDRNELPENEGIWASVHGYDSSMPAPKSNLHLETPAISGTSDPSEQDG
jgi:hypothetical protein